MTTLKVDQLCTTSQTQNASRQTIQGTVQDYTMENDDANQTTLNVSDIIIQRGRGPNEYCQSSQILTHQDKPGLLLPMGVTGQAHGWFAAWNE